MKLQIYNPIFVNIQYGIITLFPTYHTNQLLIFKRKYKPIKYNFFDLIKMFIKDLINKIL